MGTLRVDFESTACHFRELEDPRGSINQRHPLASVVMTALTRTLAGANGLTAIAHWAKLKRDLLRGVLDIPNGVPRNEAFRRLLALLTLALMKSESGCSDPPRRPEK